MVRDWYEFIDSYSATGMALGSTWIFIGGPDILAIGAEEVLKELVANISSNQCLSLGIFSGVQGNGASPVSWG